MGALERPGVSGDGPGEGAPLVAEQLALGEARRHRAAIEDHDRAFLAQAVLVNGMREHFLAGAGLAGEGHRDIGAGEPGQRLEKTMLAGDRRPTCEEQGERATRCVQDRVRRADRSSFPQPYRRPGARGGVWEANVAARAHARRSPGMVVRRPTSEHPGRSASDRAARRAALRASVDGQNPPRTTTVRDLRPGRFVSCDRHPQTQLAGGAAVLTPSSRIGCGEFAVGDVAAETTREDVRTRGAWDQIGERARLVVKPARRTEEKRSSALRARGASSGFDRSNARYSSEVGASTLRVG